MSGRTFEAFLVDLDGLLAETEHLGQEALDEIWRQLPEEPPLTPEELRLYVGRPDAAVFSELAERRGIEGRRMVALHRRYRELYLEKLRHHRLEPIPGVQEGLQRLRGLGPLALVTGSTREQAELVLERLRLPGELWRQRVTADDVAAGKPSPAPYREAARSLGTPIHRCLVVEDSEAGVLAGRAAGAAVLHVAPFHPQVSWIADDHVPRLDVLDDVRLDRIWHRRPLPAAPVAGVLGELGHSLRLHGVRRALEERMNGTAELWQAFRGAGEGKPPPLSKEGILLWRLMVKRESVARRDIPSSALARLLKGMVSAELAERSSSGAARSRLVVLSLAGTLVLKEPPRELANGRLLSAETYLEASSLCFLRELEARLPQWEAREKRILELGTGTGLAVCHLLRRHPSWRGLGTDLNGRAVHLARANAFLNGVGERLQVIGGDLFQEVPKEEEFDEILFNPPFRVMPAEIPYPDPLSRYGTGVDGLGVVRRTLTEMRRYLSPDGRGWMLLELPWNPDEPERLPQDLRRFSTGLELKFHLAGSPIPVEEMVRVGAEKCLEGDPAAHAARLATAYKDLGATALYPILLEVRPVDSQRGPQGTAAESGGMTMICRPVSPLRNTPCRKN